MENEGVVRESYGSGAMEKTVRVRPATILIFMVEYSFVGRVAGKNGREAGGNCRGASGEAWGG
jgi:hypothetical protein